MKLPPWSSTLSFCLTAGAGHEHTKWLMTPELGLNPNPGVLFGFRWLPCSPPSVLQSTSGQCCPTSQRWMEQVRGRGHRQVLLVPPRPVHERHGSTPASGKATNPKLCQTTEHVISDELWLFYFLPCSGAPEVCFSQSHGNCFSSICWYVGIRILKSLCEGVLRKTSKNHTI